MVIYTRAYPKEFFTFGEYQVLSIHHRAINFIDNQGHLFSLHPSIQYMTSFGYVLSQDDYDYLYDEITPNSKAYIADNKISIEKLTIFIKGKCINTRVNREEKTPPVTQLITQQDVINSGYQVTSISESEALLTIRNFIDSPNELNAKRLVENIGLGQGLTPSFDDSVVGMLSVIYLNNAQDKYIPILRKLMTYQYLKMRTTSVSIKFLSEALEGVVSYPFYRLIKRLFSPNHFLNELSRFKGYGHSSGIDTLLGMYITQQTLKENTL